ncbi:polysaccharide deacetylase family protein [Eubacteriales bacterium OttesenSCG-928-K08]|nr:polysaccharide deacetylase family protein [Eubacteriales bacterium OttesenSCG-928-K08]
MRVFVLTKKTLIIAGVAAVVLIAGLVLALVLGGNDKRIGEPTAVGAMPYENYELEVLAGKHRELPVYNVQRDDNKIALTIDAAWEDDRTPFILDELDRQGIKATFYLTGIWVDEYPEHVKEIALRGHELGNHTDKHPHMNQLGAEDIKKDVKTLDDKIEKITGVRTKTFRAPYGEYNDLVITTLRAMGYVPVQWNLDTIDWKQERSTEQILNSVVPKLSSGSIILTHNNGYKIEEYLPLLINAAKEQGYEFVTVSELLLPGDTMIDVNGVQKPASLQPASADETFNEEGLIEEK